MRYLLDTHTLLWWLADDGRLGATARSLISNSENEIWISVASLWEMVIKVRVRKLDVDVTEMVRAIERAGFLMLPIRQPHLGVLEKLPVHHRDPFDHLLVAQAAAENAVIISADKNIAKYPVAVVGC